MQNVILIKMIKLSEKKEFRVFGSNFIMHMYFFKIVYNRIKNTLKIIFIIL